MLLSLVIIVALIGAAVVGTIYSNFLVFYSNFAETDNYNKAYYASIAALERAELVTKQRQPGFEGTGGRMDDTIVGGSYESDAPIENNFSYLSKNNAKISTSKRHIDSLTNKIPKEGNGNVDRMLSTGDSSNFNKMDYNNSETFLLYKDPVNTTPYAKLEKKDMAKAHITVASGEIRLPQYLYEAFGDLDENNGLITRDDKDDVIVDRQVMGTYSGQQFTIFATQSTLNGETNTNKDTAIRESDLNDGFHFVFEEDRNPHMTRGNNNIWTIISSASSEISSFKTIFNNNNYNQNQIRFSLLNYLKNFRGDLYPFLEYNIEFIGDQVPDKYYTINSEGGYGDYLVNLTIIKPTLKESILKSFTTIF